MYILSSIMSQSLIFVIISADCGGRVVVESSGVCAYVNSEKKRKKERAA